MGPPTSGRSGASHIGSVVNRQIPLHVLSASTFGSQDANTQRKHTLRSTHGLGVPESVSHLMLARDCATTASTGHRETSNSLHAMHVD